MKKFIFCLVAFVATIMSTNAQNYAGSSKFTDNWSLTLQGGIVTTFNDFFDNGSVTPTIVLEADKYVTPWLGFGLEGRTTIGVGEDYNLHTAFDVVNVSGFLKINVVNLFDFDGTRKTFEPVIYTGLGWGHTNCSDAPSLSSNYRSLNGIPTENFGIAMRNYMTYRVGLELNFNLGKTKAWGIVVNPSVVWGNIDNGRLCNANGNFEVTAGVVYHFKTSNKTHGFVSADLRDANEIARLNKRIADLENSKPETVIVKEVVEKPVKDSDATYSVTFAQNSSELTDSAKEILDKIPVDSNVNVAGSTSPEGTSKRNATLAQERADAVASYLKLKGINVIKSVGGEAGRIAIITVEK